MRYEMTGRTATPFDVLMDHSVGDVFDADLDPEIERMLIGAGALRVVDEPEPEPKPKPKAKPGPKPKAQKAHARQPRSHS